jgi:hypothetical protein
LLAVLRTFNFNFLPYEHLLSITVLYLTELATVFLIEERRNGSGEGNKSGAESVKTQTNCGLWMRSWPESASEVGMALSLLILCLFSTPLSLIFENAGAELARRHEFSGVWQS